MEAAAPVDAADFHVALRNGASTPLGEDTAFTTPSGTSCMTDLKRSAKNLACLVNLSDPPARPPDVYGAWGRLGGFRRRQRANRLVARRPGRFAAGQGAPLPEDRSLSFGDFRCRSDTTALVCVNYASQSAVRFSDAGIDPYGCSRQVPDFRSRYSVRLLRDQSGPSAAQARLSTPSVQSRPATVCGSRSRRTAP